MGISRSLNQIAQDLDEDLKEVPRFCSDECRTSGRRCRVCRSSAEYFIQKAEKMAASAAAHIDRKCHMCNVEISLDERPFVWVTGGDEMPCIVMHRICLLDWTYRIMPDVDRIKSELNVTSRVDAARLARELEGSA